VTFNIGNQLDFYLTFLFIHNYRLASSPLLNISYNISADELKVTLPIETLPTAALLYLQEKVRILIKIFL